MKSKGNPNAEVEMDPQEGGTLRASGGLAPQNLYDVINRVPDVSLKYRRDDRQVPQYSSIPFEFKRCASIDQRAR
jgi:hypothetical protein